MRKQRKIKNNLINMRKRSGLKQKQIASLFSQIAPNQVSRIEQGVQLPNLKTALKFAILYQKPIRELFDGAFEICRKELEEKGFETVKSNHTADSAGKIPTKGSRQDTEDHCIFEERVRSTTVRETDLINAEHHVVKLMRSCTEKKGHI